MICTKCNYPNSSVIKSRKSGDLQTVIRRRECVKCGNRFSTKEKANNDELFGMYNAPSKGTK